MEIKPEEDGVKHINIYSKGKTRVGRFLTNLSPFSFTNQFVSIEHYWFWLSTGDDRILSLKSPYDIKPFIKTNKIKLKHVPDFKKKIVVAFCYKIYHAPRDIFEEFIHSTLPFKHYYVYGKDDTVKIIDKEKHHWQIKAWEVIRAYLKKPDQSFKGLLKIAETFGD